MTTEIAGRLASGRCFAHHWVHSVGVFDVSRAADRIDPTRPIPSYSGVRCGRCGVSWDEHHGIKLEGEAKMDERTLNALRASITKWEGIAAGEVVDLGAHNCALCQAFQVRRDPKHACFGCPVSNRSGQKYCRGTPYEHWLRVHGERTPATTPAKVAAALDMRDFLRSFLPAEERVRAERAARPKEKAVEPKNANGVEPEKAKVAPNRDAENLAVAITSAAQLAVAAGQKQVEEWIDEKLRIARNDGLEEAAARVEQSGLLNLAAAIRARKERS